MFTLGTIQKQVGIYLHSTKADVVKTLDLLWKNALLKSSFDFTDYDPIKMQYVQDSVLPRAFSRKLIDSEAKEQLF